MQLGASVIVLAIVIAVGYGVAYSFVYPQFHLDAPDPKLVSLFAILGLLTALAITGAWKAVTKK